MALKSPIYLVKSHLDILEVAQELNFNCFVSVLKLPGNNNSFKYCSMSQKFLKNDSFTGANKGDVQNHIN